LSWAGVIHPEDAVEIARDRGRAMSEFGEKDGAMLAIKCDECTLEEFTKNYQVSVTGYNGSGNFVIGGHINEINAAQTMALNNSIHHVKLKVSHAFHTPMMKQAAVQFKQSLENRTFEKPQKKVISTVVADEITNEINMHELLFNQIESPVYFTQSIDKIKNEDILLIEVGPGNALSRSLQEYKQFEVVSMDFGSTSLRGLLNALSLGYISGNSIAFDELSANRFYKEFDIENWKLEVFVNPCEDNDFESLTIKEILDTQTVNKSSSDVSNTEQVEVSLLGVQRFLKKIISEKIEIPFEMVNIEDRLMSQLHINSLAITEIISLVVKTFNKSQLVFSEASILANADGSIEELSKVIFSGENGGTSSTEKEQVSFEAIHNWSHIFQRSSVAKKASLLNIEKVKGNVIINGNEALVNKLSPVLMNANIGDVAVFVYTSSLAEKCFFDFVSFLQQPTVKASQLIALVNISDEKTSGDLRPILRTYQLENPKASTLSIELSSTDSIEMIVKELQNVAKYKEIIFDKSGQRFESEIEFFYPKQAKLTDALSSDDVILATGGGKGITFESIFSLAKVSQAKLVIIGRASPENDAELRTNLARLDESLIKYRYYSADVCSQESVHEALLKSVLEFGDITVFVHGAGVNNPKPLQLLTPIDFEKTSYVKVQGIKNVVKELNLKSLKLLIGYGSIIAESGMHGNADYAWANDQLAHYINQVGSENPNCRCMTLEWSVWSETGMGVSLNTIETLKQKGVWAIPVSHGVEILKAIIADTDYQGGRLIISGRYGEMPTLNYIKKRLPLGRFISTIKNYVPKVELVSEVNVSVKDDIYLQNHIFQGQYVFPTVMILEGMSQVCNTLTEETDFWTFQDLKINKSIFVPKNEINKVRFIVTRISKNTFKAVVQSEDSNFEVNCFEAYIKLGKKPDFKLSENDFLNLPALGIDVETKFYDDLLFHHGPFRRINSFLTVNALESIAQADTSLTDTWFGDYLPSKLILGDAGLNDAAIHCHQACRPHNNLLPTAVGEIAFNCAEIEGPFFIHTSEIYDRDTTARIDVYVLNGKGEVKQMWKSLDLTRVSGSKFSGRWNAHFLTTYIEYLLMKLAETTEISVPETLIRNIHLLESADITSVNQDIFGYSVSLKKQLEPSPLDLTRGSSLFFSEVSLMNVEPKIILEINHMETNDSLDLKTLNYANN
jgi:enediyne polyketide synthase